MKDIQQAAKDLGERIGHPPWLTSIGVGSENGDPAIIVLLTFTPRTLVPVLDKGTWEGYPVVCRLFGQYAPVGLS
jgi:hypothetical protein